MAWQRFLIAFRPFGQLVVRPNISQLANRHPRAAEFLCRTLIIPSIVGGQWVVVLHLGDHEPSGIDMSRDVKERLALFLSYPSTVIRIVLNLDPVEAINSPENPAKATDKRFAEYAKRNRAPSWELDVLPADCLPGMAREHAEQYIDSDLWAACEQGGM